MTGLAGGDAAFLFTLFDRFGEAIRATVRRHLRELARPDLADDDDEVGGLALEVCFLLAQRASGWDPTRGARPWTWAAAAIRAEIARLIGHRQVRLIEDDSGSDGEGEDGVREGRLVARGGADGEPTLADTPRPGHEIDPYTNHPLLVLLAEAVRAVGRERDQEVLLEFELQQANGDPSPAHTVGAVFDLRPDNVRQIVRRQRRRVAELVWSDERFVELRTVRWCARDEAEAA
ncbi:MAG: hypothetical protein D6683_06160 [Actinomyces sp.]|nr:MAG: hypothetical protein D6683_06160 [Actinomyces sp.]